MDLRILVRAFSCTIIVQTSAMNILEFKSIRRRLPELTAKQREQLLKDLQYEESLRRASDIAQGKNIVSFTPSEWEAYLAQHRVSR